MTMQFYATSVKHGSISNVTNLTIAMDYKCLQGCNDDHYEPWYCLSYSCYGWKWQFLAKKHYTI